MKLSPSVYLRAAQRVDSERNGYCCPAINAACWRGEPYTSPRTLTHQHEFRRLFKPPYSDSSFYWGDKDKYGARAQRILALCFMAAIAATETFND
jgi:hypothetical protein